MVDKDGVSIQQILYITQKLLHTEHITVFQTISDCEIFQNHDLFVNKAYAPIS